jgi:hypothetical protein
MMKVPYMHVWKCHNETSYFVQLTYASKNPLPQSYLLVLPLTIFKSIF